MPPELMLLLTAFVWGGYHPCMRMLLTDTTEHGSAPTPSEINLARFSLVAVLFVAQAACADAACFGRLGRRRGGDNGASLNSRGDAFGSTQSLLSAEEGAKGISRKKLNRVLSLDAWMSAPPATGPRSSAAGRNASLWGAACELAFWHFVTIAFQSTGVAYTGATRAGFIAASTTMMVPFVSTLAGEAVKSTTWIAACVAVCGTALIVFASDNARSERDVITTRLKKRGSFVRCVLRRRVDVDRKRRVGVLHVPAVKTRAKRQPAQTRRGAVVLYGVFRRRLVFSGAFDGVERRG
uniref:Drug/Metabolite transporter superfamily n=1 Tax=Micromonas pusilla TaxID=38833 RepID=A0A7S0D4K3_MICPS